MIGTYLNSLYCNCKLLAKTGEYNFVSCNDYFNSEIDLFIKENNLIDQEALLNLLITKSPQDLDNLLSKSYFIKIFYLVNSLSEYNQSASSFDELGRFNYKSSIQKQNDITDNIVVDLIKSSFQNNAFLNSQFKLSSHKSLFFLSHDIDSLYGSLTQDGLWALKHKKFDVLLKLFVNVLTAKPHWFNIDLIMKLESEYDFRSTFYWLVNKGRIDARQTNADYSIQSSRLKKTIRDVNAKGFDNGLHKSISGDSFSEELGKLPLSVPGNRFHYLKYKLPEAYQKIEEAGLKLDASLGFAEHYGFRNNYGYPFSPFNMETKKHFSFIEVPLNIMDGTFQRYMQIPADKTAGTIIDFLEKNKENCLISILWHNTFFTNYKYKGYKEEYIKILKYLYEEKFININQSGIIESFSWKK